MSADSSSASDWLKRFLVILRKILVRSLLGIILLFILTVVLIQFPAIQNYLKNKVVTVLSKKMNTEVRLGYIRINFAGNLVLEDLFIADRQQDTVINAEKLKVALNPAGLLRKKIIVSDVSLSGTSFNYLILDKEGRTNIDFIINSFAGNDEKKVKPESKSAWDIQVKKVQLDKSSFVFQNLSDSMQFAVKLGKLRVDVEGNNLDSLKFDIEKILLANTRVSLITYNRGTKSDEVIEETTKKADSAKSLFVSLKRLDLIAVTFVQNDSFTNSGGSYTLGEARILPDLIDLQKQIINIGSINIKKGIINYTASSQVVSENEETSVKSPKAESNWKINLGKSNLAFDRIRLRNLVPADSPLPYLGDISLSGVTMDLSASFSSSKFWNADINSLRFVDNRTSKLISITIAANSNGEHIKVSPLDFRLGSSHISALAAGVLGNQNSGKVPDFNANITTSRLSVNDFEPYLPKSMYPNLNRIPSQLSLTADLKSLNQLLEGKGELKTSEGSIRFSADMKQTAIPLYHAKVELVELNGGFFVQNQQLGKINATLNAAGTGFNPDSMNTSLSLQIASVVFNSIDYNDIQLQGNINNGIVQAGITTNDPVARLQMKLDGTLGDQPKFRVNTHIQNLDLYAMKLIEDTIALSGNIDASYASKGEGRFIASTDTMRVKVKIPKDEINTDSKLYYSVLGDSVDARVKSNFGNIAYNGNIPLQEVPAVIKNYFSQYFSKEKADSARNSDKYFKLDINIEDLSMLNDFMAMKIDIPENAEISARLINNQLVSDVNIEKLIFNDFEVDNMRLSASGKDSSFNVDFKTEALHNKIQTIREFSLGSVLSNGVLDSRLAFSNAASQKWFDIGATMEPQNPELNLVIQEPLLLNHQNWDVEAGNKTFIRNKNVVFNNVKLSSGDKMISLLSDARQPEKLVATFKNLTFALISEMLYGDTSYLSGKIDGELMATHLFAKPLPVFDAKLGISNIIVEKRPLGELNVLASNTENSDIANLDVNFGQDNMRFKISGTYGLATNIPMNLNLTTQNLSLAALQPLIKDVISEASGAINASLNLKGSFAEPVVNGEIGFDKTMAYIEPIQTKFQIDKQKILFRGDEVLFNNFTIKDNDGDPMEIRGKIALANLKKLNYNLDIITEEFLAYQGPPDNLPGQDNRLILTSNIKLTGEDKTPHVNANITIDEGSRFFYKITKQASTLTEEGVIEFDGVKKSDERVVEESIAKNLSLTANISVAPNTAVKIITDPVRNLGLNMEAGGIFSMSQRPYQSPRLNGRLDISGGDYTISLSGLKRKFQIADSSYIVWYGNISKPELNLRAYYEVRTSPAELIGSEETSSTLPFMVNMIISGSLDDPRFNFRLSLPSEYEGVENGMVAAKLQEINSNESELNQMAMTLLLFGSFGFNNFANVLGNNGGANVIISNALNQFAAQKLKFVDLHFDLESYDNYGSESQDNLRTEMKIAASKKLADDRLSIALGATVVLQADEQEQQQSIADRISPEFNIEYLLNKPRTLRVRTFRRSEYRGLVEGKVISTGAGILFQKDFNKLSELFKKPEEPEAVADIQQETDEEQ